MHKVLCSAIHQLALKERENLPNTMFASHLSPKEQKRVISRVGQKCAVNCLMNDKPVTAFMGHWSNAESHEHKILSKQSR